MTAPSLIREKIETGSLDPELGAMLRNSLYKDRTAAEIISMYIEQRECETRSLKWARWALIGWLIALGGMITLWVILTYSRPIF